MKFRYIFCLSISFLLVSCSIGSNSVKPTTLSSEVENRRLAFIAYSGLGKDTHYLVRILTFHSPLPSREVSQLDVRLPMNYVPVSLLWSPNGKALAITGSVWEAGDRNGSHNVFLYTTDNNSLQQLTSTDIDDACTWSRTGKEIILARDDPKFSLTSFLYVQPVDGSKGYRLSETGVSERGCEISPDGQWLLVRHEDKNLYLRPLQSDSTSKRITNTPNLDERGGRWSPDGNTLAVFYCTIECSDVPVPQIGIFDISGSKWTAVTTEKSKVNATFGATWTTDGKYLVFDARDGGDRNIYYTDKEGKDLKLLVERAGFPVLAPRTNTLAFSSEGKDLGLFNIVSNEKIILATYNIFSTYPSFAWSP